MFHGSLVPCAERRIINMKKLNDVALRLLAKAAYVNAKKEADSACLFIGYQPKMP